MGKVTMVLLLLCLIECAGLIQAAGYGEEWAKSRSNGKGNRKVTRLHFYFHDTPGGDNPSAIRIAEAPTTNASPTLFGAMLMADDPLTIGPDPKSELIGRAQGFHASASQEKFDLMLVMNFGFTKGKYNGSSLSFMGRVPFADPVREISVLGGTGLFRLARGYAIFSNYFLNATNFNSIMEFNVTVIHN